MDQDRKCVGCGISKIGAYVHTFVLARETLTGSRTDGPVVGYRIKTDTFRYSEAEQVELAVCAQCILALRRSLFHHNVGVAAFLGVLLAGGILVALTIPSSYARMHPEEFARVGGPIVCAVVIAAAIVFLTALIIRSTWKTFSKYPRDPALLVGELNEQDNPPARTGFWQGAPKPDWGTENLGTNTETRNPRVLLQQKALSMAKSRGKDAAFTIGRWRALTSSSSGQQ